MTLFERLRASGAVLGRGSYAVAVDVLRRPSLAYAFGGLLVTYLGKITWHIDMLSMTGATRMGFLAFFAEDLLFMSLVIAAIWGVEIAWPKRPVRLIAAGLMVLVAVLSALNVVWLRKTGFQLTVSVIEIGFTRFEEIRPIVMYELGLLDGLLVAAVLVVPGLVSLLFHLQWRKSGAGPRCRYTICFPALLLVLAGLGYWQQQSADLLGWRRLADNLILSVARSLAAEEKYAPLPKAPRIVQGDAHASTEPRPNVIVVFLESIPHRATSLDPHGADSTPFLAKFAGQGLEAEQMRVVIPHSTKTLYSALCGRIPALQQELVETADNFPLRCLPEILGEAGYDTAYMQASDGWFEDLPRLTDKMGFGEFIDWHNIEPKSKRMAYLAADDAALDRAALRWIEGRDRPYLLVLFTSSTHHPYLLPERIPFDDEARTSSAFQIQRYLALVRDTDRVIERLVTGLEERGGVENTVVVLMGDHGESFGDHGQYQHDNIFTDEGLRVPFAIRAAGPIEPGTKVEENRSVLDLTPTLLDLIGIPYAAEELEGTTLLEPIDDRARLYFSCFYNDACMGFVEGARKVVVFPEFESWLEFDLAGDERENIAQMEGALPTADIEALDAWYTAHRYDPEQFVWSARELFGGQWRCSDDYGKCYHESESGSGR